MLDNVLAKVFGTKHERDVKAMRPLIASINELEPRMKELSDEELAAQTVLFREQTGARRDPGRPAGPRLRHRARSRTARPQYAPLRRPADRGTVLHRGKIAEMKTGEGKTLVATLAGLSQRPRRKRRSTSSP